MVRSGNSSSEKSIFTEIELKIMLINEKIKNHEKSIKTTKKMSGWQIPAGTDGIDYSKEPGNFVQISFEEGLRLIQRDQEQIKRLKNERTDLRKSLKRIKKIYESLEGNEERVYYLRVIRKMTQEEAAEEMEFSRRHFQRIESSMRERGLL